MTNKFNTCLYILLFSICSSIYPESSDSPVFLIHKDHYFAGFTKQNIYNGVGIKYEMNGNYVVGVWKNGEINGPCIIFIKNTDVTSDKNYYYDITTCINSVPNIRTTEHKSLLSEKDECIYGDCKNLFGMKISNMGFSIYIGNFHKDKMNGIGILHITTGTSYIGYFMNDKFSGEGIGIIVKDKDFYTDLNKGIYLGSWDNFKLISTKQFHKLPHEISKYH